jgi:cell division protein FtsB
MNSFIVSRINQLTNQRIKKLMFSIQMKGKYIAIFSVLMLFFLATYVIIFGKNGYLDLCRLQKEKNLICQKNQVFEQENSILRHQIERIKSDPIYLEAIIRQKMGLVKEGERVFLLPEKNCNRSPQSAQRTQRK